MKDSKVRTVYTVDKLGNYAIKMVTGKAHHNIKPVSFSEWTVTVSATASGVLRRKLQFVV